MKLQQISIKNINEKTYNFKSALSGCFSCPLALKESIRQFGILSPLLLSKDGALVDGFFRLSIAKELGLSELPVIYLPETVSIPIFLLHLYADVFVQNKVKRAQFISFLINDLKMSRAEVMDNVFPVLKLGKADKILRESLKIAELPLGVRTFAFEKQFSHKQLVLLTQYSPLVMTQVLDLQGQLHLTAASFLEYVEWIADDLKTNEISLETFMSLDFMRVIVTSYDPVYHKTALFKQEMYTRRNPLLSKLNLALTETLNGISVDKDIQIKWDRTLENKYVDLSFRTVSGDDYQSKIQQLNYKDTHAGIGKILDAL